MFRVVDIYRSVDSQYHVWTPQDVLDAIENAYNNPAKTLQNGRVGFSKEGIEINIFFDKLGKIKTAYPIYK